jgi:pyruvate kinase
MDFYGTIGPACAELSTLQQLVRAGMTGLRMNLSHGSLAEHADWLELIQKAGVRTLLIDLQGPELRIGRLASPLTLSEGQQVFLGTGGIPCPACLLDAITPGQKLLLDDGKLVGDAPHAELLQSCEVYKEICLSQLSKEEVAKTL